MHSYALSCCSTADLSVSHFAERDISYVCFHFMLDGKTYLDDLGQTIPFEDFYKAMANGAETSTAQVNISEYLDHFTPMLERGQDILHVCLSSGLSGSYNSAVNAALIARERFPDRKIYIVDSLGASSGYGLIMETLADRRDAGMDIDALYRWIEEHKLCMNHWFFSTDLTFYVKGGRISKTAGLVGTVLGICPLLNMDEQGHLVPRSKIRSKRRVIREIVARMEAYADDGLNYSGKCFISHSACMEDARQVANLIEARFPKLQGKVVLNYVGTTIGSHTGPGTVALFFWGRDRSLPLLEN
ncbi:MAG: DegV family protein [Oscillospiraceae bacterium]|nr:DegV family protein [Oscillospiraceae bacterium]